MAYILYVHIILLPLNYIVIIFDVCSHHVQMTGCVHGISGAKYHGQSAFIESMDCSMFFLGLWLGILIPTNQLNRSLERFLLEWIKQPSTSRLKKWWYFNFVAGILNALRFVKAHFHQKTQPVTKIWGTVLRRPISSPSLRKFGHCHCRAAVVEKKRAGHRCREQVAKPWSHIRKT